MDTLFLPPSVSLLYALFSHTFKVRRFSHQGFWHSQVRSRWKLTQLPKMCDPMYLENACMSRIVELSYTCMAFQSLIDCCVGEIQHKHCWLLPRSSLPYGMQCSPTGGMLTWFCTAVPKQQWWSHPGVQQKKHKQPTRVQKDVCDKSDNKKSHRCRSTEIMFTCRHTICSCRLDIFNGQFQHLG